MHIVKPSTSMKLKPSINAPLETECLYGESVQILDEQLHWAYCKLLTDNYHGWVKKNSLGLLKPSTHRVIVMRSLLYTHNNEKSLTIDYLPMGAQISVKKIENNWAEIYLSSSDDSKTAYIPANHIIDKKSKIKDWVKIAEQIIGAPYKWGGRDTMGLDCSALLQLSYQSFGQNIPRNTKDQFNIEKKIIKDFNELERGCVVFWEGHVGIMVNKFDCLHSNAFHMKTVVEPLNNIITRIGLRNKIKKVVNFNNKL